MRASAICLVVLSMAASHVSSHPSASDLTQSFRALSSLSYKRQSNSVPSQCASACDPVQNEENAGYPKTTCCTRSFEKSYYDCLLCVGTAVDVTDYTQAQADLDQLYVSCYDHGYSLEGRTLPGQDLSLARTTSSRATTSKTDTVADTSTTSVSVLTSASATTSTSETTTLSSGASSTSSETSTSANSTATSSSSTPDTGSSAALGLSVGGNGVWVLVSAAIGLIVLWNN
ncbi:hypothetical protein DFJ58DRAFT_292864 [Suillus subalutaceus]|uniref:uncharacterized protein n=1 Tax=Suillus subalutaceus TaxID=48586 RepID=UPI001B86BBB1|nr:uncharacterized protein DFJ58DRAFT_292864 [Suillus subalutaceus]KAG1859037.1 hypothetical protein DFJ58DRAFT_292864 [Suillus subalutaceus]